jgi:sulfite dehydrogenase (cytochrome) subunit B
MTKLIAIAISLAALSAGSGAALAGKLAYQLPEETAEFTPGLGIEAAQSNCGACHSADYISSQPSKQGPAFWEAEVQKMIKVYGAPIDAGDVKAIADYLAKTY